MARIPSQPTDATTYNPNEARYWERPKLNEEINRVFDICHGCRLCFNLCPSFPALFKRIDDHGDEDVRSMTVAEKREVIDLCYECKLCEIRCPYTPRAHHEFQLDFPKLVLRARAVQAREEGISRRDRMLGDPDRTGRLGTRAPALANWSCRNRFQRIMMEKLVGIHRDKQLPEFAGETFEKWLAREGLPQAPSEPAAKILLFHTCFVNYYNPEPGKALIKVYAKNNCTVATAPQNCCGMPALDGGDVKFARQEAARNVANLLPFARQGYRIAAINPTCSMTMRMEYPDLVGTPEAAELAKAVCDPHEPLYDLFRAGKFNRDFKSTPGKVAYHVPCHLKAQNIGLRSRDLMRRIPGVEIDTVDACTSHDGTWAMKTEYFPLSMKWGERAFNGMREAEANTMSSDCPLASIQIQQGTGTRPLNPAEILARAYEPEGFPIRIEPAPVETETK